MSNNDDGVRFIVDMNCNNCGIIIFHQGHVRAMQAVGHKYLDDGYKGKSTSTVRKGLAMIESAYLIEKMGDGPTQKEGDFIVGKPH